MLHLITSFILLCFTGNEPNGPINSKSSCIYSVKPKQNDAIILVDTLFIYNNKWQVIGKRGGLYGCIVSIDSVSEEKIALTQTTNNCLKHNFVHIKHLNWQAWVYGQKVFEKENENRDTSLIFNGVNYIFTPCKNFGIGIYDEDEELLSFCPDGNQNPLLLYNSKFQSQSIISIDKSEAYSENYVTLDHHDGWIDQIKLVDIKNDTMKIQIERIYQEGFADIELLIPTTAIKPKAILSQFRRRDE